MAVRNIGTLKGYFRRGMYPTEAQFGDVLDSYRHRGDGVALSDVSGLAERLNGKYEASEGAELARLVEGARGDVRLLRLDMGAIREDWERFQEEMSGSGVGVMRAYANVGVFRGMLESVGRTEENSSRYDSTDEGCEVYYVRDRGRFVLKRDGLYYLGWNDSGRYGDADGEGVAPGPDKIFVERPGEGVYIRGHQGGLLKVGGLDGIRHKLNERITAFSGRLGSGEDARVWISGEDAVRGGVFWDKEERRFFTLSALRMDDTGDAVLFPVYPLSVGPGLAWRSADIGWLDDYAESHRDAVFLMGGRVFVLSASGDGLVEIGGGSACDCGGRLDELSERIDFNRLYSDATDLGLRTDVDELRQDLDTYIRGNNAAVEDTRYQVREVSDRLNDTNTALGNLRETHRAMEDTLRDHTFPYIQGLIKGVEGKADANAAAIGTLRSGLENLEGGKVDEVLEVISGSGVMSGQEARRMVADIWGGSVTEPSGECLPVDEAVGIVNDIFGTAAADGGGYLPDSEAAGIVGDIFD